MKTEVFKIHPEFPEIEHIAACAKIIRKGGLVIFPTETVYGIAADLSNPKAMQRLREIKGRPENKPFSVLISQMDLISNYSNFGEPLLYKLMSEFWPGPLTIVVPSKVEGETIGVRMPDNMIALHLLKEAQCTVAAPSANRAGEPPPMSCAQALEQLDGCVDAAIDGDLARIGNSSTVVDLVNRPIQVLRQGAISQADIDRITGKKTVLFVCTGNSCRSVMAEYIFKKRCVGRDDVDISSAGTSVFIHATASAETVAVLKAGGMDATKHYSQPLDSVLLKKSDLIFVMTHAHRIQVLSRVPEVEKRVYLLREFAANVQDPYANLDVPDPMGQSHQAYQECYETIRTAIDKIVKLI